jgi:hypothetical protein
MRIRIRDPGSCQPWIRESGLKKSVFLATLLEMLSGYSSEGVSAEVGAGVDLFYVEVLTKLNTGSTLGGVYVSNLMGIKRIMGDIGRK